MKYRFSIFKRPGNRVMRFLFRSIYIKATEGKLPRALMTIPKKRLKNKKTPKGIVCLRTLCIL